MTKSNSKERAVMRAGTVGATTRVIFELNQQFLWMSDGPIRLARGSFRRNADFLLVEEEVRRLVFELLEHEENLNVYGLGFGTSYVELKLLASAAGDLATYVAKMHRLLTEIFDLDEHITTYLVTERFGPLEAPAATINAIADGWGPGVIRVADDKKLATEIRRNADLAGLTGR